MAEFSLRPLLRALRSLFQRPGITIPVVLILAFGLGAATVVFSVLDGVVLSPLELREPDRLVWVWSRHQERGSLFERSSEANVVDWRAAPGAFEAVAAAHNRAVTWSNGETPRKLSVVVTTSDFFQTLGVEPVIGRTFEPGDEDRSMVLLCHSFWQTRFGGRADVLGQTLVLDREPHVVAGVLPASFELPRDGADIYLTRRLKPDARRSFRSFWVLARLAPGETPATAQQHMARLSEQLAATHPEVNRGWDAKITPLAEHLTANVRPALWTLIGAMVLVLLIAIANASYLMVIRAAERRHELAVRQALGASRFHLASRLVAESLLPALIAGLVGLALARAALPWLLARVPESLPRQAEILLDTRVLLFGLALTLVCGGLCGLWPALRAGSEVINPLRSGRRAGSSRGDQRMKGLLVVSEIALAMVLLTVAGLLGQSFVSVSQVDPGFTTENRAVVRVFGRPGALSSVEKELYFQGLEERLAQVPGVVGVGASTALPLSRIGLPLTTAWRAAGEASEPGIDPHQADLRLVTPGFLPTLGVPLRGGRYLEPEDRRDSRPVAVINQRLAEQAFPGQDPVGRGLRLAVGEQTEREIVGVVGNLRHDSLLSEARPEIYLPMTQYDRFAGMTYVLSTQGSAESLLPSLRQAAVDFDPEQPPHSLTTLGQIFEHATARERFAAEILGLFAVFALGLAAFGIYAVLAAVVLGRTREIGVRRALGAGRGTIRRLILGTALRWSALGIALGWVLTLWTERWVESLLVGVTVNDAFTLGGAAVLLVAGVLPVAWIPTRRALRIEAWQILRDE